MTAHAPITAAVLPFTRSDAMLLRDAKVYDNRLANMIKWAVFERNQIAQHPTEPCKRNAWTQIEMAEAMAAVCDGDPAEWAATLREEQGRGA